MKINQTFFVSLLLLVISNPATALNLGQILSGAGASARGMQESENRVLQNRLLELQVQEANRMAVIQQLEYQRRLKELDEARQRELQRQQQLNVEALRREQSRIAEIQATAQQRTADLPMAEKLKELAERLRNAAPKKLNKDATLMGSSFNGEKLFILIKLDGVNVHKDPYQKVNDQLLNQIDGAIVTTCLDQALEPLTRQGAVVRYSFFDTKQKFIEGIDTDKSDCTALYSGK